MLYKFMAYKDVNGSILCNQGFKVIAFDLSLNGIQVHSKTEQDLFIKLFKP
mgnify:CR=1 FL=1|jgi:asparagine synthetase A